MVDYSRWSGIEVSDDEEEMARTPNLDKNSLARFRHQSRLERLAETKHRRLALAARVKDLRAQVDTLRQISGTDPDALRPLELQLLQAVTELRGLDAAPPKDVDSLSRPGFSSTRINKAQDPDAPKEEDPVTELVASTGQKVAVTESEISRLQFFVLNHREAAEAFAALNGAEASRDFLLGHRELVSDEGVGYLHTHCLALAETTPDPTVVEKAAAATMCLQYVLESARSMGRDPREAGHLKAFFTSLTSDGGSMALALGMEARELVARVKARAAEKAAEARKAAEVAAQRAVLESLPAEMRAAFEGRDLGALTEAGVGMGEDAFADAIRRCTEVGLWVPGREKDEGELEEDATPGHDTSECGSLDYDSADQATPQSLPSPI